MAGPLTTYPGTITPLRGLAPYVEAERDVFFGRDQERDAVARLITQDGVRAGLLFGEPGVGKTSLLRAGVAPHLRDHGVVTLTCDDLAAPTDGFARSLVATGSAQEKPGEKAIDFLVRVVLQAMPGQLFVFVVDDADVALRADLDGRISHELGEMFARVTSRSGGRARFLFGTADSRLHWLDALERRTGSLFPPPARFRLVRFTFDQALDVIDRTLALAGQGHDPNLARAVAEGLAAEGPILPADVQICARALRDLGITTAADLLARGGARTLLPRWVQGAALAAGHERQGMRVLAELAASDEPVTVTGAEAASRAGIPVDAAERALAAFADRGLCVQVMLAEGPAYALAHECLVARVREVAAPARESAARARGLLAAAAAGRGRLSPLDEAEVAREGVLPATPAEGRVLGARKRLLAMAGAGAGAGLLTLLISMFACNSGRYYLSTAGEGSAKRIVAREGRAGLSAFHWMGFGDVVADTGLSAALADPGAWKRAASHDVGGASGDGAAMVTQALEAMRPPLRAVVEYVLAPEDESALEALAKAAGSPLQAVAALELLRPVARGGPAESKWLGALLDDASPAVRRAALAVALDVARRRPEAGRPLLGQAMASADAELRAAALAGVRALGEETEAALLAEALGKSPPVGARRDLMAAFAALPQASPAASAGVAAALLIGAGGAALEPADADEAWRLLEGAFARDAAAAARAAATLVADEQTAEATRLRAIQLIVDRAPAEVMAELAESVEAAASSQAPAVAAAALPLYARVAPDDAARKLVSFTDPPVPVRVAVAAAWGELAKARRDAAVVALDQLMQDKSTAVKAAAARAYGKLGRISQEPLVKLTKTAGGDLAEGAAWGLAASVEAGASAGEASVGIGQLWKKKGAQKREAARVFAYLCKVKPASFIDYCASAARDTDDRALNPIGVEGLCNAVEAGAARVALGGLRAASESESSEARLRVAECVAAHPKETGDTGQKIALRYSEERDAQLRLHAARALAGMVEEGKASRAVTGALAKLLADGDARVRMAAAKGLAGVSDAPKETAQNLAIAWGRADEREKLLLLGVARSAGAAEVVMLASRDASAAVRLQALPVATAVKPPELPAIVGGALADESPEVRAAALELVAGAGAGLSPTDAVVSLQLASTADDPAAAEAALAALFGLDDPERAAERLKHELGSPVDAVRARAARAAARLAERDAKLAAGILEPLLADASRDVRVAAVPSLAVAWAQSGVGEMDKRLRGAEANAMRRLVALDALLLLAGAGEVDAVRAALEKAAKDAPPFARFAAQLGLGLIASGADGVAFVASLTP